LAILFETKKVLMEKKPQEKNLNGKMKKKNGKKKKAVCLSGNVGYL